jgi:hypothetical protein
VKKIDLGLNFDEIRKRIEIDIGQLKPGKWAEIIGLSPQNISNVHGEARKNQPSLQYIIAVAKYTGKPIEWYLYGDRPAVDALVAKPAGQYHSERHQCRFCGDMSEEIKDICKKVKKILESHHPSAVPALLSNIAAFEDSVKQVEEIEELKRIVDHHTKLLAPDTPNGTGKDASTGSRKK